MKSVGLLVITIFLLCSTTYAERTIWYVHPDSTLNTIQAGLDSCADNDIVLVGSGTYYENIVWPNTQGIHLISELGPENTVIDGDSAGRVITFAHSVHSMTIIRGFTIQNGRDTLGAGIYCGVSSSPTITDNNVNSNLAAGERTKGGGIYCGVSSSPTITDNSVNSNLAVGYWGVGEGGGIYCDSASSPVITNNTITNNDAGGALAGGGGIYCRHSSAIISGNIITRNRAGGWYGEGGGIHCNSSSPIISGNTITLNELTCDISAAGGGIFCRGSSPTIDNCTIAYNILNGVDCTGGSEPEIHYCDIFDGVINSDNSVVVSAEDNWWGHASGPYHPTANPGGLGCTVSDYVDFDPWLTAPVGVEEQPLVKPVEKRESITATIFRGSLQLPEGKKCKVFDITGRVVEPTKIQPGIYFIEVDGVVTQKVVKVR